MEALEQNSVEWPEIHSDLRTIFDKITLELGPPDVDFRSGGRSFKVHKKVLEKHSSVLKAKLSDVWQTSGDVLQVDEQYVIPEVVEELLTWMYYKSADKYRKYSTENAYSLCVAAHYLMISELVNLCCYELCENITPENFYELYTLSKHINLDFLRLSCERAVAKSPALFFLSPKVVKWTAEELKMFIEKTFKVNVSSQVRETILASLAIWTKDSFEDRFEESEKLLKLLPPESLSSNALFRFMETELYLELDDSGRKQYSICPYLLQGTDKLYCIQTEGKETEKIGASYRPYCLNLSAGGSWSKHQPEYFSRADKYSANEPVLGASWRRNIYFLGASSIKRSYFSGIRQVNTRVIKVFSTETDKWDCSRTLDNHYHHMLAAVALNGYIYATNSTGPSIKGTSFNRYCIETKQWEALKDMQTARLKHQLVALNGFVYAIGGEAPLSELGFRVALKPDEDPRPERYDPQTDRWEYIAPSHYHHELPVTVAHKEQIYVLSQADLEAYSSESDQWTPLLLPNVCIKPSLVSIGGKLWLLTDSVDCHNSTSEVSRLAYEFNVVKQEWTRLPDLPEGDYTDLAFVIKQ